MTAYGTPTPTVRPGQHAMSGEQPVSVGPVNPVAPRASDVVAGLRSSPRFALAVDVYQAHQRDSAGRCRSCGSKTCRSRRHAATIIAAAGVNLADVDTTRCGIRLRRHQRAFPVRGVSPHRVKIARIQSRLSRRLGESHRQPAMATRGLRTSVGTAALLQVRRTQRDGSMDRHPLCGRLFCRCGQRFIPGFSALSGREYVSLCGCRLWPIDAAAIEQRVYAHATCGTPASESRRLPRLMAAVLSRFDERIEVGGTLDDIRINPRT
jgi:hypothetical protein